MTPIHVQVKARIIYYTNWVEVVPFKVKLTLDASLTDRGRKYAKALAKFIECMVLS